MQVDLGGAMGDQRPGTLFALGSSKELKYIKSLIYQMKVRPAVKPSTPEQDFMTAHKHPARHMIL